MKVSIITVSFNSENTIRDTICSVLNQTYKNIEYIIVDGNSNDNTLNIVRSYKNKIAHIVSEPDEGIYDAMNKGIKLATGDIIGILNSDDLYAGEEVIETVVNFFQEKNVESVYGDIMYVDFHDLNKVVRFWKSNEYNRKLFYFGWHPPHPAFFVKREVYEKYGNFRTDLKIASDYEIMLRFLFKNKISTSYLKRVLVKMRIGGESNKNFKNILKANIECLKSWKINGFVMPYYIFFTKPFWKLSQCRTLDCL